MLTTTASVALEICIFKEMNKWFFHALSYICLTFIMKLNDVKHQIWTWAYVTILNSLSKMYTPLISGYIDLKQFFLCYKYCKLVFWSDISSLPFPSLWYGAWKTETATTIRTSQICIFNNEKHQFCTLCTCASHFCTFCIRFRPFHDVKWHDLSTRRHFLLICFEISKLQVTSFFNENTEAEMPLILKNKSRNVPEAETFFRIRFSMMKICEMQ